MTTTTAAATFIDGVEERLKTFAATEPEWLTRLRNACIERFQAQGVPTTKDEEWKYTNIVPATHGRPAWADRTKAAAQPADPSYLDGAAVTIVFVNGRLTTDLASLKRPDGLTVERLSTAVTRHEKTIRRILERYAVEHLPAFFAFQQAVSGEGVFIDIAPKTVVDTPVHIVHVTSGSGVLNLPRTVINVGKSAEATILESHLGSGRNDPYLSVALTDIDLCENGVLHYCKAEAEDLAATHVGLTRVWQERNANLDGFSLQTGAGLTRNNLDIIVDGEGANATLNGLYSIGGRQHVDNHTSVDHRKPNCTSTQLYKGILTGKARAVFNGKIYVKSIAQQTNSYQLNKNLILGEDCRIDTKPQLEIYADDVKCTHGATIGQLEPDEIFYLQTRSISRSRAVKMLSRGFVDEIINTIPGEFLRERLNRLLEPSLAAIEG